MNFGQAAHVYRENLDHKFPSVFLSDEDYGKAISRFPRLCADVILMNSARQVIYLTRRKLGHPSGWWWIGGSLNLGELEIEAAKRNFKRETSLDFPLWRFDFMRYNIYFWADRDYEPKDFGSDDRAFTFFVEASDEEIASAHLDLLEYEEGVGLQAFDRQRILTEPGFNPLARQIVLDMYDEIFWY